MRPLHYFIIISAVFLFLFSACDAILPPGPVMSGMITTVAGIGSPGYWGDNGAALMSQLNSLQGLSVDSTGNIFIADSGNYRIRKVDISGKITTVAGGGSEYHGDNEPAVSVLFRQVPDVAVDSDGNLFIAESMDCRVRKVDTNGIITTYAGNGTPGYSGDGLPATSAQLYYPFSIAIDPAGNLFISESENNCIRKVDSSGIISTFAGNGTIGSSGDNGPAVNAQLNNPHGLASDKNGNLYIADSFNCRIRKVDSSGIITTIAGTGICDYAGDYGPAVSAQLGFPDDLAVDTSGNIFIADTYNWRIRKIDTSGIITTVAGNGTENYSTESGTATLYPLSYPTAVAVDSTGNIFVAENMLIHRVRKVWK